MRNSFIFLLLQCCTLISNSQLKWCNQKPSGWINYKIYFTDNSTALMVNSNGDLFRTTDTAKNWQLQQNFPGAQTMSLKDSTAIIPTYNDLIYISSDNGLTWQEKHMGISNIYSWAEVVSRDTIFLVTQVPVTYANKLYRSSDRGNTWQLINNDLAMYIPTLDFVNSKIAYGRRSAGISKTTDGGVTWQLQYPITSSAGITALKFYDSNIGLAYRESNQILKTVDGGNNWTSTSIALPDDLNDIFFISPTNIYACGDYRIVVHSVDGGNTWTPIFPSDGYGGDPLYSLFFVNDSCGVVVGMPGSVWRTSNRGVTWQSNSVVYRDLFDISFGSNSTAYAISLDRIYKSIDKGESWTKLPFTLPSPSNSYLEHCLFFSSDTGIVTASMDPKVYRTTNGGQSWSSYVFNPGLYYQLRGMSFPNSHTGYVALGGPVQDLYKTTDGGINWQKVGNNLEFRSLHFVNDSVGYATQYFSVWRTLDSGKNWTQMLSTDLGTDDAIWFVNARKGTVGGGQGNLRMTVDSGLTWTTPTIADDQHSYFTDIRFFNDTVGYFTTAARRLYKTIDGGVTWTVWGQPPWSCESIWFTSDTTIHLAGRYGEILSARVDEYRIDSLKAILNAQCNINFSAKVTSVISTVDSIWFEFGTTGYTNSIIASPFSAFNATVLSIATPQGLLSNTQYILRVRVLYKGNYFYSDSIHFSTPALTTPMITANGNVLSSSATSGNQWFLNGAAITGATNQQYTATTPGVYTVQTTSNGCLTMSAAYNYMVTGVIDLTFNNEIIVFPNPVRNILTIKNPATRKLEINLSDLQGRLLKRSRFSVQQYDLSLKSIPSGVYLLFLLDLKTGQFAAKKIVKL